MCTGPSFGFCIHGCCGQWDHPSWSLTSSSGEDWHFAAGLTMGMHELARVHWNGDILLVTYRRLDFVADEFPWSRLYPTSPGFHLFLEDAVRGVFILTVRRGLTLGLSGCCESEEEKTGKGFVHICMCLREIYEPAVKTWPITSEIADTEVKKTIQKRKSKADWRLSN